MSDVPIIPSGAHASVTVPLPVFRAVYVPIDEAFFTVLDEKGEIIQTATNLTVAPGSESIEIIIPPETNELPVGSVSALRQVQVVFVGASATYNEHAFYVIKAQVPLVPMTNSFVTLAETHLVRTQMTGLEGFAAATEDTQIAALVSAWRNMSHLRYKFPVGGDYQSRITSFPGTYYDSQYGRVWVVIGDITLRTLGEFQSWPSDFVQALKRAQMAEANELLQLNPISEKRRTGVISETIGESSMTFRGVPDIQMPISRVALQHLRGFLENSVRVGRA